VKAAPLLFVLALAACGQSPEAELVRLGEKMQTSVWKCQDEVLSGTKILAASSCKQFSGQFREFMAKNGALEKQHQTSFGQRARQTIGWETTQSRPCDAECWKAVALAESASGRFRRLILVDQGCHPFVHGDAYFSPDYWEDIEHWQVEKPCPDPREKTK
jgi:hypothetical protein